MRELTFDEVSSVEGGLVTALFVAVVAAVVGAVVTAAISNSMEDGPSATLPDGTTIQCESGQNLEVSNGSAKCT